MERREFVCIGCPLGCNLSVDIADNGEVSVTGNTCNIGAEYGKKEVTNPTRILTSVVKVNGGTIPMVSVKTKSDIPKGKIMECMKALKEITVRAPIHIGDVIVENIAGTGVSITATKEIECA